MESLRESGAIEQDADAILLLHTPDRKHAERRELLIAKNKEGETEEIPLYFAGELQRLGSWIQAMNKYRAYEAEKRRLNEKNLPPKEYEAELKKLIERLKI